MNHLSGSGGSSKAINRSMTIRGELSFVCPLNTLKRKDKHYNSLISMIASRCSIMRFCGESSRMQNTRRSIRFPSSPPSKKPLLSARTGEAFYCPGSTNRRYSCRFRHPKSHDLKCQEWNQSAAAPDRGVIC